MTTLTVRSLNRLALSNLNQHRLRAILSGAAVALGAAMIVATDVIGGALRQAVTTDDSGMGMMGMIVNLSNTMLTGVGLAILAVAGFLVFNAFAMSITQRRQQIGALRALGMTRGQITRMVLLEAVILGVVGTLVGIIIGPLLGAAIIGLMSKLAGQLFIFGSASASAGSLLTAAVLGIGMTLAAVLIPARAAAGVSPLAALRESEAGGMEPTSPRRMLIGSGVIAVMGAYLLIAPPGKWVSSPMDVTLTGVFILVWLACLGILLPGVIDAVGRWAAGPLSRRWGATGRLIADNLRRSRRRVTLTITTLAVSLGVIIALTGAMGFFFNNLLMPTIKKPMRYNPQIMMPFDLNAGMGGIAGKRMSELNIPADVIADAHTTLDGQATVTEIYTAFPPELAPLMPGLFSYVMDARSVQRAGDALFTFSEGDWATALPIMDAGCGLLVAPTVGASRGLHVGGRMTVTGAKGPVECTIAGMGTGIAGVSIISIKAAADFDATTPLFLMAIPHLDADQAAFKRAAAAVTARHPGVYLTSVESVVHFNESGIGGFIVSMNGILLLAVLAAALGIINTTLISIVERRRELGLLRAVGCTRRQVMAVVAGEAALMGLIGAALGFVAGGGLTVIFAVVYGGNSIGVTDLALWPTALAALGSTLLTGIVGLIGAPLIAAGAAWLPARGLLKGAPIDMLTARQ
jgi:putative ABC transport system permease protein